MSGMDIVSLRLSDHEKDYLVSIAEKFNLKKQGSDELSHTKALKHVLSFCLHNEIDFSKKEDENLTEMRKMLEQIHASIPHLMYHQKFQSVVLANKYSDEDLLFDKTEVKVNLFKINSPYISRSEAKRLLLGLEKFNTIILDFKDIGLIGQGFADEIFRVWQNKHPKIILKPINASKIVEMMISRVLNS